MVTRQAGPAAQRAPAMTKPRQATAGGRPAGQMGGLATGFSGGKRDADRYRQIAGQGIAVRAEPRQIGNSGALPAPSPTPVKASWTLRQTRNIPPRSQLGG